MTPAAWRAACSPVRPICTTRDTTRTCCSEQTVEPLNEDGRAARPLLTFVASAAGVTRGRPWQK
jgi:hypothetical protein